MGPRPVGQAGHRHRSEFPVIADRLADYSGLENDQAEPAAGTSTKLQVIGCSPAHQCEG
ncbi:MAG: hypothetical protein NVS2B15_19290 [Pseudarthrobacter sp.]